MYLLVTGASGHIGSAVAHECNKNKVKTILLTRSQKKREALKKKFKYCEVKTHSNLKKKDNISFVIHTASLNDKESNTKKNSVNISLDITRKIFSKININNLKKIIYLSTAQVYGSNLFNRVDENTKLKPINNYGLSRLANELYLEGLSKKFDLNLLIIRISNVVGDPVIFDKKCLRLLPNDIKNQAKRFESITLRSSGLQSRNFVSLLTTSKLLIKLIKLKTYGIKKFNLGGVNTSVILFVKKFIYYYEKKSKKKLKLFIQTNKPKKSKKLNFQDNKLRKLLKISRKETLEFIIKTFLKNKLI
jgi:UDP-glucose 4-epimerase